MHPVFPGIFGVTKTTCTSFLCVSVAVSIDRTVTREASSVFRDMSPPPPRL
jgi:hypothetical protein